MTRGLEGDRYHPVHFAFTTEQGGPSSDGTPDPEIVRMLSFLEGRIVDIGSGDGRYTKSLLERGVNVVATDKNTDALVTLRDYRSPTDAGGKLDTVRVDAFKELPFDDRIFDGAVSTALLHLRPPAHIRFSVKEMNRVVRPKGLIVVDLSTDVRRIYKEGARAGEEAKGHSEVSYSFQHGQQTMREALSGLFSVEEMSESYMNLDLATQDGPVNLTTRKINVLARRI